MSAAAARRLGLALGGAALVLLALNVLLVWVIDATGNAGRPPAATIWILSLVGAPLVGLLISSRQPGHPYSWLLLSLGLTAALLETTELGALYLLERSGATGLALAGAVATQPLWSLTIGHIPLMLLLFPDGRLPSARWRWLVRTVVATTVVGGAASLFIADQLSIVPIANPLGTGEPLARWINGLVIAMVVILFLSMLPAAAALFVRRRRGSAQERLQLRWFSWAAMLFVLSFLVTGFGGIESDLVSNALVGLGFTALYAAIGIAVLRYRLYEIDRVLSRTVSYAALTVLVVAVYLTVVTMLTRATSSVTGESPLAVAASTLVAAAVIGPARLRIQSVVDRRFNRAHYDAVRTADAFRARLRDQFDLQDISDDLVATTRATMQPSTAMVWLRWPSEVPR